MTRVLVVTDENWVRSGVHASLTEPTYLLIDHGDPRSAAIAAAHNNVAAVVTDLQVGSMGGMAVARAIREHANVSDALQPPVVLLLDRGADAFLARRSGAAAWVTKPFSPRQLQSALEDALATSA